MYRPREEVALPGAVLPGIAYDVVWPRPCGLPHTLSQGAPSSWGKSMNIAN